MMKYDMLTINTTSTLKTPNQQFNPKKIHRKKLNQTFQPQNPSIHPEMKYQNIPSPHFA